LVCIWYQLHTFHFSFKLDLKLPTNTPVTLMSDSSPRRRNRSPSNSPPRRTRSPSNSPPRKKRSPSNSPPRRKRGSPINSPPRRSRISQSPPRKRKRSPSSPRRFQSKEPSPVPSEPASRRTSPPTEYGRKEVGQEKPAGPAVEKQKPDFGLSGKLSEEQRTTVSGVVLKFVEPPDAKKPVKKWRLYPFKGDEALEPINLHHQSAFLVGRDRTVADIPVDHPSCSKQHAVIQFRYIEVPQDDGGTKKETRPYLIDLESTNGSFLNKEKIDDSRYIELKEKDVLKFGFSTREFVLLHEDLVP